MQDKWDKKEAPLPLSENDSHLHQNGSLSWSASAKAQDEYSQCSDNVQRKQIRYDKVFDLVLGRRPTTNLLQISMGKIALMFLKFALNFGG